MAAGDTITNGFNPSTFSLGCGFTRTDDSVYEDADAPRESGSYAIDGKYNIYFRFRSRDTKTYEGTYRLYTTESKARYLTNAHVADYDMVEFIMCTNTDDTIQASGATGVIDKETVPIIADGANGTQGPEGPRGSDVGENLIDGTGTETVITSSTPYGANSGWRWYNNLFTLNDVNLSPNLHYSCQMRVKLEGCSGLNGNNFHLQLNTKSDQYPFVCEFTATKNGTYSIKKENFTFESLANAGFHSGVTFGWSIIGTDITLGTITIDKVKLEVGEKCTSWCLSENDKKGKDGDVWTIDADGYWCRNGVRYIDPTTGNPVRAEGTDGTGVEIKGEVDNYSTDLKIENGKGYAKPVGSSSFIESSIGDCYVSNSNRHLYSLLSNPLIWKDLGEFKGEPGQNSYMHIAYANTITILNGVVTGVTGFTVDNAGIEYDWWGFCTDNSETDPGRGASSTDVTAARNYKWNYMKGKDGDGTEYIYLLTKEGFTPTINQTSGQGSQFADEFLPEVANYSGNQSKIYPGTGTGVVYWQDDPPASVSATWPVLWWAKRDYTYNSSTGNSSWENFGSVTLHNRYSKDGTSPWFADLDNEMDSVSCNASGVPSGTQTVSTNISLFYGINKKEFSVGVFSDSSCTHAYSNSSTLSSGIAVWWTSGNHDENTVNVKLSNAYTFGSDNKLNFYIKLTAKDDSTVGRVLTFTINGVKPGEDGHPATIFRLQPSASSVKRDKSNNLSPSSLTCDVLKVVGNDTPTRATSYDGTLYYLKNGDITSSSTSGISTLAINTESISLTATDTYVTFAFFVGTKMVDKERVPVVYDGDDGNDAVNYEIVFTEAWAKKDNNGEVTGRLTGNAYKIEGATRTALANTTIRMGYTGGGSGGYTTKTTDSNGTFSSFGNSYDFFIDDWDDTDTCNFAKSIYASIIINNVAVCTEYINISFDGQKGDKGLQGCVVRVSEYETGHVGYRNDEGKTISSGTVGYIDVVGIEDSTDTYGYKFYRYKSSTESTSSTPAPPNSTYWEALTNVGPIYTSLLVAKYGYIKFGTGNQFVITNNSNEVQAGMKGDSTIRIWAGANPSASSFNHDGTSNDNLVSEAPFRVYDNGHVVMTSAEVAGTINASTIKGTIVVGDNTNAKAYMEIVPTTEVTEGSDQVYRADILGKSAGIAGDALDIGVYRLKNSTVMGSHITVREVTTGGTVNSAAHVGVGQIAITDSTGSSSMTPLNITTHTVYATDVSATSEVTTKKVKGVDSKPVAFPSNIITSDKVELDHNLPAGAIIFAPNCQYVKSLQDNVYASRNDDGPLNNLTTTNGHKFGNQASRIFVKYSTTDWKEFDCQGP